MKEQRESDLLENVIRHIRNVQDNCIILGERLIANGKPFLGRMLIHNGFQHDASKLVGIEWEYLKYTNIKRLNKEKMLNFKASLQQHVTTNKHHPECWGNIHEMPDIFIAEMVCDWKARSEEFGTSLYDWIDEEATKKFNFTKNDDIYKKIMEFVNILCNRPFEQVKPTE